MRYLLLFLPTALACHGAADPPPPAQQTAEEVRLDPKSPKLGYLAYDTVRTESEHLIAVLPATLAMDENHTVRISSPVTGRIRRLLAEPGARVTAGQPLAIIGSSDMAQAASDLAKADAGLTQATAAVNRARDLYEHQVIARKDLEQAESDAATARAEAARARQRVELLGNGGEQGEFLLRAPIAGSVVQRTANPGAEVRPDAPDPLFTVSGLDSLWLTSYLSQRDVDRVRVGDRLSFTTEALPGQRYTAVVTYVSGALDPETRTATLRATLSSRSGLLKPEMFGEARLLAPDRNGAPVVPTTALVTQGSGTVVFVQLAPGRFERREVTVESDDGVRASLSAGVHPGDVVVTRGSLLLAAELAQGS